MGPGGEHLFHCRLRLNDSEKNDGMVFKSMNVLQLTEVSQKGEKIYGM